eukprot:74935_1
MFFKYSTILCSLFSISLSIENYCSSLDISNYQCQIECLYYNNINLYYNFISSDYNLTELVNLFEAETNITVNETLLKLTLRWFTLSSFPYQYYGSSNPEICQYSLGTYCNIGTRNNQRNTIRHGCCLPNSCTGDDAVKVLESNMPCYQTHVDITPGRKHVICSIIPRVWDSTTIIFIILSVLFVMVFVISTYIKQVNSNKSINIIFDAFCLQTNWRSFTKTRSAAQNEWGFCDGIRVISAFWVVLYHSKGKFFTNNINTNQPSVLGDNNSLQLLYPELESDDPMTNNWPRFIRSSFVFLTMQNLAFMVTFFWMSGFFGVNSMVKILQKWRYKRNYLTQTLFLYIKRWLRLSVMLAFMTLFNLCIYDQIASSYSIIERNNKRECCSENWYKSLFMYREIYNIDNEENRCGCVDGSWYVSADFQLSLYLPIICFLWVDIGYIYAFIVTILPIIACIITRIYVGFYYHFYENPYSYGNEVRNDGNLGWDSYSQSWSWMANYFLGSLFMLIIIYFKENYNKFNDFALSRKTYWILQSISIILMATYTCTPYSDFYSYPEKKWNITQTVFYYALGSQSYCVGLTIFVFCLRFSPKNHYSILKQFLSCNFFEILAKLTYIIYLMHQEYMNILIASLNYPSYFSWYNAFVHYIAVLIGCTISSLVLWICIQNPINVLIARCWKYYILPIYSQPNSVQLIQEAELDTFGYGTAEKDDNNETNA